MQYLYLGIILFFSLSSFAQTVEISGRVFDEAGEPLPGAVLHVNDSIYAITDIEGNFRLRAEVGDTVICSYVGFNKNQFVITDETEYKITLEEFVVYSCGMKIYVGDYEEVYYSTNTTSDIAIGYSYFFNKKGSSSFWKLIKRKVGLGVEVLHTKKDFDTYVIPFLQLHGLFGFDIFDGNVDPLKFGVGINPYIRVGPSYSFNRECFTPKYDFGSYFISTRLGKFNIRMDAKYTVMKHLDDGLFFNIAFSKLWF
ncbi:carboxypeptidase-like regulatory domain-containing protein [Rapidithrix thailandica]|uniref:Carboxypeptidase-like regulatory domain-containing protein n=1 Tax=Rapidithrix thailandica TaxID=413964 RepID=A0AAW9S562_9BACT